MPPRKKKDPNAPKRPMSDFMLFQQKTRAAVKEENPDASFGDVGKIMGEKWRAMSDDDKKPFRDAANKAREEYLVLKAQYDQEKADNPDSSADDSDEAPAKKKRKKKDPNAPKGALSAFMFFAKDMRPKVSKENPEAKFGELGKIVGKRWRELDAAGKKPYNELAAKDKQRYQREKEKYDNGEAFGGDEEDEEKEEVKSEEGKSEEEKSEEEKSDEEEEKDDEEEEQAAESSEEEADENGAEQDDDDDDDDDDDE